MYKLGVYREETVFKNLSPMTLMLRLFYVFVPLYMILDKVFNFINVLSLFR